MCTADVFDDGIQLLHIPYVDALVVQAGPQLLLRPLLDTSEVWGRLLESVEGIDCVLNTVRSFCSGMYSTASLSPLVLPHSRKQYCEVHPNEGKDASKVLEVLRERGF